MIDTFRKQIEERLHELLSEAEKLRRALAALDPRAQPKPEPTGSSTRERSLKPQTRPARSVDGTPAAPSPPSRTRARRSGTTRSRARTAPGATKAKVLATLSTDGAMTAGEVAKATGLARPTVSTTLSKLAKSGEVTKAERGYRLPAPQ
jgi:CRP-like cAMP-binding protein